jgi:nitrous oxidase accessory protein NosD
MFNVGGSGVMAKNNVSYANDAISSNWSSGVQFLDNEVTHSGSGVHTDNAGDGSTTADLIQGNTVTHCQKDGYGIFVFAPYLAPTVKDNEIHGCTVGLAAFGQGSPVMTIFTDNTLNGTSALSSDPSNSFGVMVSTDLLGWGSADVSASFTNNKIRHFNTGVYVEQHCEFFGLPECSPSKQATAVLQNNVIKDNNTGANGMPGTSVNAEKNWWGCNKGPNHPGCDTAIGTVDFTPWLTKPPKD